MLILSVDSDSVKSHFPLNKGPIGCILFAFKSLIFLIHRTIANSIIVPITNAREARRWAPSALRFDPDGLSD